MKNILLIIALVFLFALAIFTIGIIIYTSNLEYAEHVRTKNYSATSNKCKLDPQVSPLYDSSENDDVQNDDALNYISFKDWTDENWLDNDYYRFLRESFDDCYKSVENENTMQIEEYKDLLNNQFFIFFAEPFLLGGIYIIIGFIDNPEILYETVVYSEVDEETETISGYRIMGFKKSETTSSFTKESLLEIIKNNPENKLW